MSSKLRFVASVGQIAEFRFGDSQGRVIFENVDIKENWVGIGFLFKRNGRTSNGSYKNFIRCLEEFKNNTNGRHNLSTTQEEGLQHDYDLVYIRGQKWCKDSYLVTQGEAESIIDEISDDVEGLEVTDYNILPILF